MVSETKIRWVSREFCFIQGWTMQWTNKAVRLTTSGSLSLGLPRNFPLNSQWILPVDLGLDSLFLTLPSPAAVALQSRWFLTVHRSHYSSEDGVWQRGRSFASWRSAAFLARTLAFPRKRLSGRCSVLLFSGDVCFADQSYSDVWFPFRNTHNTKAR